MIPRVSSKLQVLVAGSRGVGAAVGLANLANKVRDLVATRAVVPGSTIAHADDALLQNNSAGFAKIEENEGDEPSRPRGKTRERRAQYVTPRDTVTSTD